jgi:hypothetical protein
LLSRKEKSENKKNGIFYEDCGYLQYQRWVVERI